jgi:hypothetical protein
MTTLLVALGILAAFGALFWLDRYYKNTGNGKEGADNAASDSDRDDTDSQSESS